MTELSEWTLSKHRLGEDVELVYFLDVEDDGDEVVITSSHRISISVGLDWGDSHEISLEGAVAIGRHACSGAIRVSLNLDKPVASWGAGPAVPIERRAETSSPVDAARWILEEVKDFLDLDVLLSISTAQ
jgi:hypothetical protein